MGCFLLQKNILLMRLILLGYYAAFFPVKFPRITSSKYCTIPRRHTSAGCTIMGHHGAVPRHIFTLAQVCASGVTVAVLTSQMTNANTGTK